MKIQLKRSNVLESGEAKEPTSAQMEYGEIAVNYNSTDPSLFIKDSADAIVKVSLDSISSGLQPGDNVSTLNNDAGYITDAGVESINGKTGAVTLYLNNLEGVNVTGAGAGQVLTYSGSMWNAVDGGGLVDSVNGQTGVVVLDYTSVNAMPLDLTVLPELT